MRKGKVINLAQKRAERFVSRQVNRTQTRELLLLCGIAIVGGLIAAVLDSKAGKTV